MIGEFRLSLPLSPSLSLPLSLSLSLTPCSRPQGPYNLSSSGELGTLEYRLYTVQYGQPLSAWHDVPLYGQVDGTLNFVCEIPANTTAKFEVQTKEPGTPIAQDSKNGLPRDYAIPILWNYGMLPQTWEDPDVAIEILGGAGGDNDPTDVVELGAIPCSSGQVYSVKPICAFAMIDDGEVDWKVVAISPNNPKADAINGAADAEEAYPGELEAIREWFKFYKTVKNVNGTLEPSGDPPSEFGFDEACVDGEQLAIVLEERSSFYQALVDGQRLNTEGLWLP